MDIAPRRDEPYPVGSKVFATCIDALNDIMIDVPCVVVKVHPRHPAGGEIPIDVCFMNGDVIRFSEWHLSDKRRSSSAYRFMVKNDWVELELPDG